MCDRRTALVVEKYPQEKERVSLYRGIKKMEAVLVATGIERKR
jgi:hypothetical protein